jgi:hypothetical protein
MLDVQGSDLPVFYFHRGGVFSFVVDVMVTVVFEVVAEQLFPVMVVMALCSGGCSRGIPKREQPENDNHGSEKTLYTIPVHA